jgi:hypothetical protein
LVEWTVRWPAIVDSALITCAARHGCDSLYEVNDETHQDMYEWREINLGVGEDEDISMMTSYFGNVQMEQGKASLHVGVSWAVKMDLWRLWRFCSQPMIQNNERLTFSGDEDMQREISMKLRRGDAGDDFALRPRSKLK